MMKSGMQESNQEIIDISSDTNPKFFRLIIDYIYGRVIKIPIDDIIPFFQLVSCYAIDSLRNILSEYLKSSLSISNACCLFMLSDLHGCIDLKTASLDIIFNNFLCVSQTDGFFELSRSQLE